MKQVKYSIFIIIITLFFSSCTKEFLEQVPEDRILADNFFEDLNSVKTVVNATYAQLTRDTWERSIMSAAAHAPFCGADDFTAEPAGNKRKWRDTDIFAVAAGDISLTAVTWDLPYDVILQANFAIQGGDIVVELGENREEVDKVLAEVYFLRAWAYFWLVRLNGDVPIILEPEVTPTSLNVIRNPITDVYSQILSDLEKAIADLPENQSNIGRVTKFAAYALRSKVYLTMSGWPLKEGHYTEALADAEYIIQNGTFSLYENFSDIFDIENEFLNSEFIWQVPATDRAISSLYSTWNSKSTMPPELGGFKDVFVEIAFYNNFPDGVRKDYTFLSELLSNDETYLNWTNFQMQHPFLSKFYSGSAFDPNIPYQSQSVGPANSALDICMYRLSEINMIYAEANVMGGGGNAAIALEYVNQIRRRAKGVDINTPDVDDLGSLTLQAIIDERGWEFVGEMKRWFDLIRTETVDEAVAKRSPEDIALVGDPANKNLWLMLLPEKDIRLNPNLTQNPR